jgi:undecaprenyl-diphosphatase
MNIYQAIILGIIQGITEFFPISSSGHLVIFQALFGLKEPQLAFDIFLHFGTLISIAIFFHKDIIDLFNLEGCLRQPSRLYQSILFYIIIASIPTFIIGFLFKDAVENFFGMPKVVGAMLVVTGAWLIFASARSKRIRQPSNLNFFNSIIIGIAQGIAVMPGISRSGATIGAGLATGLERENAFKFSFLLAIPAVAGACILKAHKITTIVAKGEALIFLAGGIAAAVTGLVTLRALLGLVKNNKLALFGIYCILAGLLAIILVK